MPTAHALACVALIVRDPFDCYRRGDCVRDPQLIKDILASEQKRYVNKILVPAPQETPTEQLTKEPLKALSKTPKKSKE
jgi:hypothetical protein